MRLTRRFGKAALVVAMLAAGAIPSAAQQGRPDPPGKLIDVGGHKVHLFCQGSGVPAVILVSTIGGFSVDWALVQTGLAQNLRVCSWDRASSAWSDMTPNFGELDADARDLSTALRNAGIPPPYVLAGHAQGALLVRDFHRLHPGEVAGMVLIDSLFEEQGVRAAAENGLPVPLLDMSETNLRQSLEAYPAAEFTPASPPTPEDSIKKLPPAMQTARSWAEEQWNAALRTVTQAQWAAIMESTLATYGELYKGRLARGEDGSQLPLGKLPLALITTSGDTDAEREAAFARLSENGQQIVARRSGYPSPIEQPELVVETISKVVAMAQANAGR